MAFTLRNLKEDLADIGSVFDGPPDLKFRAATKAAGKWRGYEAGPDGLELLVIGSPNLGEDPCGDVGGQRDWWAD